MGTLKSIWGSLKRDRSSTLALGCTERKKNNTVDFQPLRVPGTRHFQVDGGMFFWGIFASSVGLSEISHFLASFTGTRRVYGFTERRRSSWDHTLCAVRNIKSHVFCHKPDGGFFVVSFFFFLGLELSLDARLGSFHASKRPRCRCAQSRRTLVGNPGKKKMKKKRIKSMCLLTCCTLRHCKP